jgi:hypothetical protein
MKVRDIGVGNLRAYRYIGFHTPLPWVLLFPGRDVTYLFLVQFVKRKSMRRLLH